MNFKGTCCSLESIVSTKGCRVKVYAGGNCAWIPRCGECDKRNKCNTIYSTINQEACPDSDYPVLEGPAPGPTNLPLPDDAESNYPTMFPTEELGCPPEPTNPPAPTESPTDPQGTKVERQVESFALSIASPAHCDTIIEEGGIRFQGDCCALNVTAGMGCVLNVRGGRCKVGITMFFSPFVNDVHPQLGTVSSLIFFP